MGIHFSKKREKTYIFFKLFNQDETKHKKFEDAIIFKKLIK
jgi:hypothetical protein